MFLMAAQEVQGQSQEPSLRGAFGIKEHLLTCQAVATHNHISHALHTAHHTRVLCAYRHAYMHAAHNLATFLLRRHQQQIFREYHTFRRRFRRS